MFYFGSSVCLYIYLSILPFKNLGLVKEVFYAHEGCIYLIKNTLKLQLQFKITVFYFNMYYDVIDFSDDKAEFSAAITPTFEW